MKPSILVEVEKFNHHHPITKEQKLVDFGTGKFIADKKRIPLLKALNACGLKTRTHCYGHKTGHSFVGVVNEDMDISVRKVYEGHSRRKKWNGKMELLIRWKRTD